MATPEDSKIQSWSKGIILTLKGVCMGVADVIPGVSGGTIALILGIYEDFIASIKSFDMASLRLLLSGRLKEAADSVSWRFLGYLGLGIGMAVLVLAKVLDWLLVHKPTFVFSFFFGLIAATVPMIARIVRQWSPDRMLTFGVFALASYHLVAMVPLNTPDAWWFVFLSGAVAISAMIMPGISGSFILLLLGKYQYILQAINDRDILALAVFLAGILVGVVTFVRILSWLFTRHHDWTLAALAGIVLGSLNKIWPWKETLSFITGRHGERIPVEQVNVWPSGWNLELAACLCLMVTGLVLAFIVNREPRKVV